MGATYPCQATAERGSVRSEAGCQWRYRRQKGGDEMKKITIRKTGSIKLTTSASAYGNIVPISC